MKKYENIITAYLYSNNEIDDINIYIYIFKINFVIEI